MKNSIHDIFYGNNPFDLTDLRDNPHKYIKLMKEADTNDIYETVLDMQFYNSATEHLGFFFNDTDFKNSERVIDFACGPGHFLKILSTYFPHKSFKGIDSNKEFVKRAQTLLKETPSVEIIADDLFNFDCKNKFDYATARMLVQHIEDLDKFLKIISSSLKLHGIFHIIDAADELEYETPLVPSMKIFRESLANFHGEHHQSRNVCKRLEKSVINSDFTIESIQKLREPFAGTESIAVYIRYNILVHELVARILKIQLNINKLIKDFLEWFNSSNVYAQWGFSRIILRKTS